VDTSQHAFSGLDELEQIQSQVRDSRSVEELRLQFERVKRLKYVYSDDFDALIRISAAQDEIIERARELRDPTGPGFSSRGRAEPSDAAEIPPEVERLDAKNWQRAIYIGLFFALILFAAFFYLIQTARRLNLMPVETASQTAQPDSPKKTSAEAGTAAKPAPVSNKPALRLYTDLNPGTVTVDDKPAQELKDGELILNNLEPGRHSIQVNGNNASAAFSYEVREGQAPRLVGSPTASNVMAVLVSTEDGKAQLNTNADKADVSLDGNAIGQAGSDTLALNDLGKTDHLLQIAEGRDRQRFVLAYTPAPNLTVYVKSDPNAGTVVINAQEDGADVYLNDRLYRRKTQTGPMRIPLKVGEYTVRVHKAGFIDPPPETVTVKKAEETALNFKLEPVPQTATLEVKGALPGTIVYVDKEFAATIGPDGHTGLSNIKPGDHVIELRRDQALPKRFERTFRTGDQVVLSGPDVTLEKVVVENTTAAPTAPPPAKAPETPQQNASMEVEGQQLRKGGGFVPYHIPRMPGRYSFAAQALKGGFLKHSKLQWYAGYQDSQNYILFTVDGKHAAVREVRNGESREIGRMPFESDSSTWVQVDLVVRPSSIDVHVKTPETPWQDLGPVTSSGRDFTQGKVGFYIPEKDEIAVANFKFSAH
jgi:PEGA domain